MAQPWDLEDNWESGDSSGWSSETDTGSQLDFPSYKTLAALPSSTMAPYRGAYCMRTVLSGASTDAFVTHNSMDQAQGENFFVRFMMYFSDDFTASADEAAVNVFEIQDTSNVVEGSFGYKVTAATDAINFGIGETTPDSFGSLAVKRGTWYCIELDITNDPGSNDGTIDLYVTEDGDPAATAVHATQVSSLNQGAITHGVLGTQLQLGTTTGTILFDQFVWNQTTRVYPPLRRFPRTQRISQSAHIFVGPGSVEFAELRSSGTNNVISFFDTDSAVTLDDTAIVAEISATAATGSSYHEQDRMVFSRGCYAQLAGTAPVGVIGIHKAPAYGSVATIRNLGRRA